MATYPRSSAMTLLVGLAAAVHAAALVNSRMLVPSSDAMRRLGASVVETSPARPELFGPLGLWDGEWWRLPVSLLHHRSLFGLWVAAVGIVWFGRRLAPRVGGLATAGIALAAGLAGTIVGSLFEEAPLGMFGPAYGLLGVAVALRRTDGEIAAAVSERVVLAGLIALGAAAVLAQAGLASFPWIAWAAACVYGWLAGRWAGRRTLSVPGLGFLAANLLLAPALFAAMHPVWTGRYLWHRAVQTTDADEKEARLRWAVERDPGLSGAWRELVELELAKGDASSAWRTVLGALSRNRSDAELTRLARDVWGRFETDGDRRAALDVLAQVFPVEDYAWQVRLGIEEAPTSRKTSAAAVEWIDDPRPPEERFPLDRPLDLGPTLDGVDRLRPRELRLPPADPNAPDNAVEGKRL